MPLVEGDTDESLAARILQQEPRIYPQAIRWFAEGRLRVEGRVVHLTEPGDPAQATPLIYPPLDAD